MSRKTNHVTSTLSWIHFWVTRSSLSISGTEGAGSSGLSIARFHLVSDSPFPSRPRSYAKLLPSLVLTDIITRDGVLHVPARVLIPPHKHTKEPESSFEPFSALDEEGEWDMEGEDVMTIEELKARLEPYL